MVQRRPLRRRRGAAADHRGDRDWSTQVSRLDWSQVEPAIFGTLFERGLDPSKRTQLGAHYTDRDSIMRLIEPVLLTPLRRDFEATKEQVEALLAEGKKSPAAPRPTRTRWRSSTPSSNVCAPCASSIPPAARATSSTWPCSPQGPRARGDPLGIADAEDADAVPADRTRRQCSASS